MFTRSFIVLIAALVAVVLVTQASGSATVLSNNSRSVSARLAGNDALAGSPAFEDRFSAAVYSDKDGDCCMAAIIGPVASCAPDCAVAPAASPVGHYDRSTAVVLWDEPAPSGPVPTGLYRPPISAS